MIQIAHLLVVRCSTVSRTVHSGQVEAGRLCLPTSRSSLLTSCEAWLDGTSELSVLAQTASAGDGSYDCAEASEGG